MRGDATVARNGATNPALFPSGVVCDRYRIDGVLGIGGSGTVFRAQDLDHERPVALKAIPHDAVLRQRARREASVASRLDHPNVVRLLGMIEDSDYVYIASELVDGCDLAAALRVGRLSDAGCLRVAARVCEALAHAHEHGIVHRDVKPGNVLLGRDGRVCLADFGIAALAEPDATVDDRLLGTLSYMAPETARGYRPAPAADIWGVGVLLYECLTGANPFRAREPSELKRRHGDGARPLREVRADLPRSVLRACHAALSPNPARRPTAMALALALEAGADAIDGPVHAQVIQLHPREDDAAPHRVVGEAAQRAAVAAIARLAETGLAQKRASQGELLVQRIGPAVCAGALVGSCLRVLPFWPASFALPLAAAAAIVALLAPWPAAALSLALILPAVGNVSSGLAWVLGCLGAAWLLACAGAGRRALLPALAPIAVATLLWPVYILVAGRCRSPVARGLTAVAGVAAAALWHAGPAAAAALAGTGDAGRAVSALVSQQGRLTQAIVWAGAAVAAPYVWQARRRGLALSAWLSGLLACQILVVARDAAITGSAGSTVAAVWIAGTLLALSVPARSSES